MKRVSFFLCIPFALSLVAAPSQAGTFVNTLIKDGSVNTYEDQSRETIVDVDQSGGITNGDVIVGWLALDERIDPAAPPSGLLGGTGGYVAFSQQITNVVRTDFGLAVGYTWEFVDTTVAGLTIQALTGDATLDAGTVGVLYEDIPVDLVGASPGDLNGNGLLDNEDFIRSIAMGTKLLEIGHSQPTGSNVPPEFQVASAFNFKAAGVPTDTLALLDSIPFGSPAGTSFDIGLTVLESFLPPNYLILPIVPVINPVAGGVFLNDIGVVSGTTSGASNASYNDAGLGLVTNVFSNTFFGGAKGADPNGLSGADYYPAADNANFLLAVQAIPEPGSLSIFAVMVGGLAVVRRRRRNKK